MSGFKVSSEADPGFLQADAKGYSLAKGLPYETRKHVVRTPTIHGQMRVNHTNSKGMQQKVVSHVEMAPPTLAQEMGKGFMNLRPMTPSQAVDFVRAQRTLNQEGILFLDNKYNNFGFETVPETGLKRVVVHDPGALVPMNGATPEIRRAQANYLQQKLSAPPDHLVREFRELLPKMQELERLKASVQNNAVLSPAMKKTALDNLQVRIDAHQARMMRPVHEHMGDFHAEFRKHVDYQGMGLKSPDEIPYNVINGFMFERPRHLMRNAHDARQYTQAMLDIQQRLPGDP